MGRIPAELIDHLGYDPHAPIVKEIEEDDDTPQVPVQPTVEVPYVSPHTFSEIEQIRTRGRSFSGFTQFYDALRDAEEYAGKDGFIPTMPELIDALSQASVRDKLWRQSCVTRTEEYIGIDHDGKFVDEGNHAFVVVHGMGITSQRIKDEYDLDTPNDYSIKLTDEEFEALLEGNLPSENIVPVYSYEEFMKRAENTETQDGLPRYYGVVLDYKDIKDLPTHIYSLEDFMENPLVLARAGGRKQSLEDYFNKTMSHPGIKGTTITGVPNFYRHRFETPNEPEGWLLEHNNGFYGTGRYEKDAQIVAVPDSERKIDDSVLSAIALKLAGLIPK